MPEYIELDDFQTGPARFCIPAYYSQRSNPINSYQTHYSYISTVSDDTDEDAPLARHDYDSEDEPLQQKKRNTT